MQYSEIGRIKEGTYRPSCVRYVGTYDIYPYYGARNRYGLKIRILLIISLIIASASIFALYYTSKHTETPVVYIRDITSEMDYARVKIIGYAYTSATYDDVQERLYFSIVDEDWTYNEKFETQTITVYAYTPTSRDLIEQEKVPVSGDKIEVTGTLRVGDSISLIINEPDDLTIKRDTPESYTLEFISYNWEKLKGEAVRVSGWIVEWINYTTFITGSIKDYSYLDFELSVYVPEIVMRWLGEMPDAFVGDKVEIVGNLWEYRGSPEIVPWSGDCISILEKLSVMNLSTILSNMSDFVEQGRIVMINVTIVGVDSSYHNKIYVLDESISPNQTVTVWIDISVWEELDENTQTALNTINNHVIIIGECNSYQGKFEIAVHQTTWILKVW